MMVLKIRTVLALATCLALGTGIAQARVTCANSKGWRINAVTSHADGEYCKGEPVVFDFIATKDGEPLANWDLELALERPGKTSPEKLSVTTDADGRYRLELPAPDIPGWIYVQASIAQTAKAKDGGRPAARFAVGAMCDRDAIRPALAPPEDFKAFWQAEIAKLASVPMDPKLVAAALRKGDRQEGKVDAWEFTLGCVGPRPATGYLVKPKAAKPKSLPIIVFFQGASGTTVQVPSWYGDVAICLAANKFGIPNGLPAAEYENPGLKAEVKDFPTRGKASRDESFFKWLILRDLRILEFAKAQPEWDGRTVILNGESLGGAQALAVGALDKDVTFVCACVPALSDHNAAFAGRHNGWPRLWTPGADGRPQTDADRAVSAASRYVDTSNFCTLYTPGKEVSIGTGWIDAICPPEGVIADFNAIPKGVVKNLWVNPKAGHDAGNAHGGARIDEILRAKPASSL